MKRLTLRQAMLCTFDYTKIQKHRHSEYIKLTPEKIFDLLNEVSGRFKTKSTAILTKLASRDWHIESTIHEGGSDSNAPLHITLVINSGIHLNCKLDKNKNIYIYEITCKEDLNLTNEQKQHSKQKTPIRAGY